MSMTTTMTTTMRLITMTLMLMLMLMMARQTEAGGRPGSWPGENHHIRDKVVTVNNTRYGSNLCHECTTTVSYCMVQKKRPCVFNKDGGVLVSNTTHSKIDFNDNDDDDDDDDETTNVGEDGKSEVGRRRRKRAVYRGRRNWREWRNNRRDSSSSSSEDSDEKGGKKAKLAMCRFNVTKRCWERRCEMKCCDGSPMDSKTNGCKDTDDGGLVESCLNGGKLNKDKTHCQCPSGFSGLRCQNRKCSVKCQNGGICQTRSAGGSRDLEGTSHNDDYCVCPINTKGKFCEDKVCTLQCKNNGTCKTTKYSIWSRGYCTCPKGFRGSLCEKGGVKEGECPKRSTLRDCNRRRWRFECNDDSDCPGIKKCCSDACFHRVCVYPNNNNATCLFRNVTYSIGMAFNPDPCHLCTCNVSHVGAPQGVVECARIRCPETPKYCTKVVTPKGQCCPVCEEEPDVAVCAGNYKYPHFTNCPKRMLEVKVDNKDTKLATITGLGLEAEDCQGDPLKVMYSEEKVMAGKGEENFMLLTATSSRDGKDNFAECAFHIQVKDPYPPVFVTCPDDLVIPRPGPVIWDEPVAVDNVGLAKPPTSIRKPGVKLGKGEYAIEYYAEDLHGNGAVCKFLISVGLSKYSNHSHPHKGDHHHHNGGPDTDHDHPHHQGQHQQPQSPSHSSATVAVCVTTSLIVIILIVVAAFFWRRQRSSLNSSGMPPQAPGMGTGSGSGSGGPMRWNLNAGGSVGVPQYSLPPDEIMSPPAYNRVDGMIAGLSASGGQEAGELPSKSSLA